MVSQPQNAWKPEQMIVFGALPRLRDSETGGNTQELTCSQVAQMILTLKFESCSFKTRGVKLGGEKKEYSSELVL